MAVFEGVGVALVTIFDADLRVDVAATAGLAADLAATGLAAILVAGTTGEAVALDPEERIALVRAVRDAVDVPVIAGTGAPSAHQAARLTAMAAAAGADAALVLSPARAADPRHYYATVAAAAGDLPLLAYHFPAVSPPGISLPHLRELPVVGLKDSTGDPTRLLEELTTYDGQVYVGSAALVTQAAALGATGVILALANAQPEDCLLAFEGAAQPSGAQAQLRLAAHHLASRVFPAGIKGQVAARWGLPVHARLD